MKSGLFDELKKYGESNFYPFHMPGHKRNLADSSMKNFYQYDITEIDGFDNLHHPCGVIQQAQERAAALYGSEETYFLVNGSTAGILSAVSALTEHANKLIIARNCHKAVYHAAFLNRLELYYLYPEFFEDYDMAGAVTPQELERVIQRIMCLEEIEENQISSVIGGVVVTSPTYEGVISDIRELARLCHNYRLPLVVDQAHGAHFGLHPDFPENAVIQGADLVIHSTHKTLPAPTQTALLHRNGALVSKEGIERYLCIYQSSSPSYLLMAGVDEAIWIAAREGRKRLSRLLKMRESFIREAEAFRCLRICPYTEPGKLIISVKGSGLTGRELYDRLRQEYHLQLEMAEGSYVLAIVTMMDTQEGFDRLLAALQEVDAAVCTKTFKQENPLEEAGGWNQWKICREACEKAPMSIYEAYRTERVKKLLSEAEGEIAGEFINLYPPGIPLIVPGERVKPELLNLIWKYLRKGYSVQGVTENKIEVTGCHKGE